MTTNALMNELEQLLEQAKQDDLHQLQEIVRLRKVIKDSNIKRKAAEQKTEALEKENAELRREVEHYRTFYIEVTNSDPVSSFVGGDPVGYLATNGMLSKLEKAIGE